MRRLVVFLTTSPVQRVGGEKGLIIASEEGDRLSYCITNARAVFEKKAEEVGAHSVWDVKVQVTGRGDRWAVTFIGMAFE
jgi:hypothetical protein